MPITLNWEQIQPLTEKMDMNDAMREAFIEYSKGNAVIPPVGELIMHQPPGEVHIKYGYIKGGDHYVIKIASGFPQNQKESIKGSKRATCNVIKSLNAASGGHCRGVQNGSG